VWLLELFMDDLIQCFINKTQVFSDGFSHQEFLGFIDKITNDLPDTDEFPFFLSQQTVFIENQLMLAKNYFYEIYLIDNVDQFTVSVSLSKNGKSLPRSCFDSVAHDLFSTIQRHYAIVI
jgi:hypothetical protein